MEMILKNSPGGGDGEESFELDEVHPDDEGGTTGVAAEVADDAGLVDSLKAQEWNHMRADTQTGWVVARQRSNVTWR